MKILYIAPANSIHTQKWINAFSKQHDVTLISMQTEKKELLNCKVINLPIKNKLGYYLNALKLHYLVKKINPDVINVHYASGYGTLARLARIGKYILNVWGSDVYDFPYRSKINMLIMKNNLKSTYQMASTSLVMKQQIEQIYKPKKEIVVTPFGINTTAFYPNKSKYTDDFVVGTVKTLSPNYGISTLIKAFNYACDNGLNKSILVIVGDGEQRSELEQLVNSLNIKDKVKFIGKVSHSEVPSWLNRFDIYCALSEKESFGVAAIEAQACAVPVIVSDAPGFTEVVKNNVTGIIVQKSDYVEAGKAILKLANDSNSRNQFGLNGRKLVLEKYEWSKNVKTMNEVYLDFVSNKK